MKILLSMIAASVVTVGAVVGCQSAKAAEEQEAILKDSTFTKINHPDWTRNAVIYEVNWRQATDSGTITRLQEQLPRLKDLGVDVLWLMPVNPISEEGRKGGLGSYYAVKDYKALNPELGTMAQFKEFVKKAHDMGFKVILDWVANHSGRDNAWVKQHPDWYERDAQGNMYGPYDWTDVFEFNYDNKDMRAAMIDAMKFWLTDVDIDGFRCDVAMEVPTDFWNEARAELDKVKPGMFMLAEASVPALEKEAFDMAYNWPQKDLFNAIAATAGEYTYKPVNGEMKSFPVTKAVAIDSLFAEQDSTYPRDSYMMNMITNHDLNSWEGTEFQRYGKLTDAMAVLTYTLPGMPLIYTGQETGMNRAFEFFVKDTPPDFEPRNGYFDFYKTLNQLKHEQPALRAGVLGGEMKRYPTKSDDLYIFSRTAKGKTVTVFTNLGSQKTKVEYKKAKPDAKKGYNIFSKKTEEYPTALAPGAYAVFINE